MYQKYKQKKISDSVFNYVRKVYDIKEDDLTEIDLKCEIRVIFGIDKNNKQIFIFDTNNDLDFNKEKVYTQAGVSLVSTDKFLTI